MSTGRMRGPVSSRFGDETRLDESKVVFVTICVSALFKHCAQIGACLCGIGNLSSIDLQAVGKVIRKGE